MSTLRTTALVVVPSLLCLALACGGSNPRNDFAEQGSSGASGASGTSNGSSSFGSSGASGASGTSGNGTCAAVSAATAKAKVDIIFVIDDSGSMTEELAQIKTNVNTFASKIGTIGLDYTVTFIVKKGTSGNTICVPAPLAGASCADNPPKFHHVNQDVQSTDSFRPLMRAIADTSFQPLTAPAVSPDTM